MRKFAKLSVTAAIVVGAIATSATAQETIKIGVTQPLTGAFAASGNYVAQGAKIAEDEIRAMIDVDLLARHCQVNHGWRGESGRAKLTR